jgi:phosphoserine phosphatase RsbX
MTLPQRLLDWAWAGVALEDDASGDVHVVAEFGDGVLVGVIDGLGHGVEAAAAAKTAARILESSAGEPLSALVDRCHQALHRTRGVVMSLASFDARDACMTWTGVGNVEAFLVRATPGAAPPRETIVLRGGIVGFRLPALRETTLPVTPGDTLIMATDGIRGGFGEGVSAYATPREIADSTLATYARDSDDALVLVARYVGAAHLPAAVAREGVRE